MIFLIIGFNVVGAELEMLIVIGMEDFYVGWSTRFWAATKSLLKWCIPLKEQYEGWITDRYEQRA